MIVTPCRCDSSADEWVVVIGGWNFAQFHDNSELFTVVELDNVLPNILLYIQEGYRHGFANSVALEAAGVAADSIVTHRVRYRTWLVI